MAWPLDCSVIRKPRAFTSRARNLAWSDTCVRRGHECARRSVRGGQGQGTEAWCKVRTLCRSRHSRFGRHPADPRFSSRAEGSQSAQTPRHPDHYKLSSRPGGWMSEANPTARGGTCCSPAYPRNLECCTMLSGAKKTASIFRKILILLGRFWRIPVKS